MVASTVVHAANEVIVDPEAENCSDEIGQPFCSIQPAIERIDPGGIVRLGRATFDLWGQSLLIDRSLSLVGSGAGSSVIDGGGPYFRAILRISSKAKNVRIASLSLRNRSRSGGSRAGAGGISHRSGNLSLEGVSFLNLSGGLGGAVHSNLEFGRLRIADCVISGGHAFVGGGVSVQNGPGGSVFVENTAIVGNHAVDSGGGLYLRDVATIQLRRLDLSRNSCGHRGGGLQAFAETVAMTIAIDRSRISANECRESGGVDLRGADVQLRLSNVASVGNLAPDQPDNADCAAEGSGRLKSLGGNVIGKTAHCNLSPVPEDRIGTAANPMRLDSGELSAWLKR